MRHTTKFHPVFCIPDSKAVTVQLWCITVNLEVNMQLPVTQSAWLHTAVQHINHSGRHAASTSRQHINSTDGEYGIVGFNVPLGGRTAYQQRNYTDRHKGECPTSCQSKMPSNFSIFTINYYYTIDKLSDVLTWKFIHVSFKYFKKQAHHQDAYPPY